MHNSFLHKLYIAIRILVIIVVAVEFLAIASATVFIIYLRHHRPPCIEKKVIRLASEDNTTDAVLREEYCDRAYLYKLYFVPSGAQVSSSTVPVMVKSGINISNTKWLSAKEFHVEYERGDYLIRSQEKNFNYRDYYFRGQEKKIKYNLSIRKN